MSLDMPQILTLSNITIIILSEARLKIVRNLDI